MENMLERAMRNRIRFKSVKGNLTTEDLWHITWDDELKFVLNLLNNRMKELNNDLFDDENKEYNNVKFKFDVAMYIYNSRKTEYEALVEANEKAAERAAKKQTLLQILEQKQTKKYENMSEEEILQLVDSL